MGCNEDKSLGESNLLSNGYSQKLKEAIDSNSSRRIDSILDVVIKQGRNLSLNIDSLLINHRDFEINALCYSVISGNRLAFVHLIKSGSSFLRMQEIFEMRNLNSADIICAKGYRDLLKVFLPHYLGQRLRILSLITDQAELSGNYHIHIATREGMLCVISTIHEYFINQTCPPEFNPNTPDLTNGENCGLLACRYGNLVLLKYFHETCQVNLKAVNNYSDNSIIICLKGFKKFPHMKYHHCICYLIEIVQVDFTYRYHDMMSLVICPDTFQYLSTKLENSGINLDPNIPLPVAPTDNSQEFKYTKELSALLMNENPSVTGSSFF